MVRSILIGLDGSPYSANALNLGIAWAQQFNASLAGLAIVDEPTILEPTMAPIGGGAYKQERDEAVLARARQQVKKSLDAFAARCRAAGVTSRSIEAVGLPSEQVVIEAQRHDLILLGQKTYFHFATQEEPCDTLKSVLKNTPRPVVTAPEKADGGSSVVVAYDGSVQAARALQAFQASGLADSRPIHVVTIADDPGEAARIAARAVEFLQHHGIPAEPFVLSASNVDEAILAQARLKDAGLIVMGAYGQPTIKEFFLGSVTRSLLEKSTIPLFLYH